MNSSTQQLMNKMLKELKIRIKNPSEIESKLIDLGASFSREERFTDTYFNQPDRHVLKLATTDVETNLIKLEAVDGRFEIISRQKIHDISSAKKEFSEKYGIRKVLTGRRRFFDWEDLKITICFIDEVGEFLVLTGENPTDEFFTQKLGLKNPEYIKVSFDKLTN